MLESSSATYRDLCQASIARIMRCLPEATPATAPDEPLLRAFTQAFYASLSYDDLEEIPSALAAHTAAHVFTHYRQFDAQTPAIHIDAPAFLAEHYGRQRLAVTVMNADMPFLVDSLSIALNRLGFSMYRTIHPQLMAVRDAAGGLRAVADAPDAQAESCIYFELSALPEGMDADALADELRLSLRYVAHAVDDWRVMMAKAREVSTHVVTSTRRMDASDIEEATAFFDWLLDKNFIFLGYVAYDFYDKKDKECFTPVKGSALGIFRIPESDLLHRGLASLPPEVRHFALQSDPVEITKSNRRSLVHRDVLMDYIGVKRYDAAGKVIGESRFVGLFTSPVYYQETTRIPYIRRKVAEVIEAAGYDRGGHSGKALRAALEFFPRDELFQISTEELLSIALGIVSLEERPDIRVFFRRDRFERFISCFVFMPRDKYNTYVRQEVGKVLERHLSGEVSTFYTQLTDSALARVNFIVRTTPGRIPALDHKTMEQELRFIVNYWVDALREALQDAHGDTRGEALFRTFGQGFARNYSNVTPVEAALEDIAHLEQVLNTRHPAFYLFTSRKTGAWHLKMYGLREEVALSDTLPMLENIGFRVRDVVPYRCDAQDASGEPVGLLIRDFSLLQSTGEMGAQEAALVRPLVEELLAAVWAGQVENDALGALTMSAGLNARQIMLLRTYLRYGRQAGLGYSEQYVIAVLCKHAGIAALIAGLFEQRFDPQEDDQRQERADALYDDIIEALQAVDNLAEDRILRFFAACVRATLRTNYYQRAADGGWKDYISLKFDSAQVPGLPLPLPLREIFVYSMRTEGIHLRGGMVARGGLRWSDRMEDFRTEVLGLMKAQMVKNTVIVPTGSKGGFVAKLAALATDRDERQRLGIESYRQFLSGLLDITDNRVAGQVVPPTDVVRYDGDDPYLVVAADKGTATFSDIANEVARIYGFWLDDAFASGGSAGYDHKKMGITARGAWVSVERHFRELGVDVSTQDFTVIGIGDMSGDVFGNGMLLSPHIRLLGAFNHLHIFLDPNPDARASFTERGRLFELGRGSWDQYDSTLISEGGGVFLRSAKNIPLSEPVRAMLGTQATSATPNEVIRLLLCSEAELLWNGGIGTYVKASFESHEAAGDPGNNALRVNADELRVRVIGEGGNLGMTQLARIEYARAGGRLNTDAIDNSAGVDCSDHEVNIKIALQEACRSGALSEDARNTLLAAMTDNVAELVLEDNRQQNQALSIASRRAAEMVELHAHYIRALEHEGLLDRAVECLPSDKQLQTLKSERKGLTRPELAVLLSYSKMALYRELAASKLVSEAVFTDDLLTYFPVALREAHRDALLVHPLRREIVATRLTNEIVNRAGLSYLYRMMQDTGHAPCNIVRAYVVVRDIFELGVLWEEVEALDGVIAQDTQTELFTELVRFLERMTVWFLTNNAPPLDMAAVEETYGQRISAYRELMVDFVSQSVRGAQEQAASTWHDSGVPEALAERIASLESMVSACDIAMIDQRSPYDMAVIGRIYFELGARLQLGWLRLFVSEFQADTYWDRLAVRGAINEIYEQQRRLSESVLELLCDDDVCETTVGRWVEANAGDIARFQRLIHELRGSGQHSLSMVIVALRQLSAIRAL